MSRVHSSEWKRSDSKQPYRINARLMEYDIVRTIWRHIEVHRRTGMVVANHVEHYAETSSLIGNQTSSIEPLREPVTIKDSKTGQIKQYAPDVLNLIDKYDYAFDTKDLTERFIKTVAVFQRWVDQGISMNTFYNPDLYSDSRVPMQAIWNDIKLAKKLGLKTIYYSNVYVSDNEDRNEECENCSV